MTSTRANSARGRMAWALVAGCLLALPVGWLLATLAMLPFFLGLFFCMLFSLLVGAVVYRVGKPAAPQARPLLWMIGIAVGLAVFGVSLVAEYYNVRGYEVFRYGSNGFAWYAVDGDVTRAIRDSFAYRSFTPEQVALLRAGSRQDFLDQLAAKYPPGGFPGFLRWALADGSMECPRVFSDSTMTFQLRQRGVLWVVRLALSLVLITAAILSQVLSLGPARQKDDPDSIPDSTIPNPQSTMRNP